MKMREREGEKEKEKKHTPWTNNCNCICDANSLHICTGSSAAQKKRKKRINSAEVENNEGFHAVKQCSLSLHLFHALSHTHKQVNKSTKVWLNSRSKHNWKLKYKRWQNNCFVANDHAITTTTATDEAQNVSFEMLARQNNAQPSPLIADEKCTHRFSRLTTLRLWHWINWTFYELYTKTDGWPPAAGLMRMHPIDLFCATIIFISTSTGTSASGR